MLYLDFIANRKVLISPTFLVEVVYIIDISIIITPISMLLNTLYFSAVCHLCHDLGTDVEPYTRAPSHAQKSTDRANRKFFLNYHDYGFGFHSGLKFSFFKENNRVYKDFKITHK